ncbi:MAG: hypothetical protein IAE99_11085 [Rhodothermales bacterium]|nr:hypothetical protein [Rhodothermales bacterium]
MRLLVPLLALATLPACRTVYTYAPPATLEVAVARIDTATVTLTLDDGTTRRIRRLRLTDSTLVFSPSRRSTVHEVPRQDVVQLESFNVDRWMAQGAVLTGAGVAVGGMAGGALGALACGGGRAVNFPQAAGAFFCALTGLVIGAPTGGILAPNRLNPRHKLILYRRRPFDAASR